MNNENLSNDATYNSSLNFENFDVSLLDEPEDMDRLDEPDFLEELQDIELDEETLGCPLQKPDHIGASYILTYRDKHQKDVVALCADSNNSNELKELIKRALSFIERNCGYRKIQVRRMFKNKTKDKVETAKVITGYKEGEDIPKVIHVDLAVKHNLDHPLSIEETKGHQPITCINDLTDIIDALVVLGDLSFDPEALKLKGESLDTMPKIMLALVLKDDGYRRGTYYTNNENEDVRDTQRHISNIWSNDPMDLAIESKSSYGGCSYSTTTHAIRYKAIEKLNGTGKNNFDIEPLMQGLEISKKIWLWASTYYSRTESTITAENIHNNILFSDAFFGAFLKASGRVLDFSIIEASGLANAFFVDLENKDSVSKLSNFSSKPLFHFSSNSYLQSKIPTLSSMSITKLLTDGWITIDRKYRWKGADEIIKNNIKNQSQIVSYWLYQLLLDFYFKKEVDTRTIIKPKDRFTSKLINRAFLSIKAGSYINTTKEEDKVIDRFLGLSLADGDINTQVSGLSFLVGTPLFNINFKKNGVERSCSVSTSNPDEGFVFGRETFTMIFCSKGEVSRINCCNSFDEAMKILIDCLSESDEVKSNFFDHYDVLRELTLLLRAFDIKTIQDFRIIK